MTSPSPTSPSDVEPAQASEPSQSVEATPNTNRDFPEYGRPSNPYVKRRESVIQIDPQPPFRGSKLSIKIPRRSSQVPSIPQSPGTRSQRTSCPPDGDAFSYDPIHLAEWKMSDPLWDKLPQHLLTPIAALQHAAAAVRTGFARLHDIGVPIELVKHNASLVQDETPALFARPKGWSRNDLNPFHSTSGTNTRRASMDKAEGPVASGAAFFESPFIADHDSPFTEDPANPLAPSISNSTGIRTQSTSSGVSNSFARPSRDSSVAAPSPIDFFALPPSSSPSYFTLPSPFASESQSPCVEVGTPHSGFPNFTEAEQNLPKDAHTMRYLAEVRALKGESLVRLRHAARRVESAWRQWQQEESLSSMGEVGKEFYGWWKETVEKMRDLDDMARMILQ